MILYCIYYNLYYTRYAFLVYFFLHLCLFCAFFIFFCYAFFRNFNFLCLYISYHFLKSLSHFLQMTRINFTNACFIPFLTLVLTIFKIWINWQIKITFSNCFPLFLMIFFLHFPPLSKEILFVSIFLLTIFENISCFCNN